MRRRRDRGEERREGKRVAGDEAGVVCAQHGSQTERARKQKDNLEAGMLSSDSATLWPGRESAVWREEESRSSDIGDGELLSSEFDARKA